MAYGLPVEGSDGPFLGAQLVEVPTCDVAGTVGDARVLLEQSGAETVVVVAGNGLAVGEVDGETLDGHDDADALLEVMDPVPTTVRPSVTLASVAEAGGGARLVTTSDGRLLGQTEVEVDDADHEGHDHEGHDHEGHDHEHDDHADDFDRELALVMEAIEERFGDREPSEAELRTFLHGRLVAEGRSAEEADQFLDQLEAHEDDG
jgi:CBS domain-containing protein